jgi:acetyltransferase-like isoleucine patch superfamily enzyme
MIRKAVWVLRAAALRLFFANLGRGSYVGGPTYLSGLSRVHAGARFRAFPGLRLEVFKGGELRCGDDVSLAQDVHITCMGSLVLGDRVRVAARVTITDIDHEFRTWVPGQQASDFRYRATQIGSDVFVGTGSVIQAGTTLGQGCVVGANSVVRGEFPEFSVLVGAPARVVRHRSSSGGNGG